MLLNKNSRTAQRKSTVRTNAKSQKRFRSFIPVIFAGLALISAVAFSISVESRRARPDAARSNNEEASKEKTQSVSSNPNKSSVSLAPLTPFVPTITATKNDSLFTDVDMDGKADPGDTLKYTVSIGASGENATGVNFTDTVDPNTTFVGGSLAASPVATNDTFPVTVVGNVRINSANLAAPFSVVSNDFLGVNPTSTISAFDATTANGGQIVMTTSGADIGKFTYNPPAGFEGVDTFTYTLTDNANVTTAASNRTATVSITVNGMIWFINNNAPSCLTLAAGCGRLTNPFSTLAAFAALNNGTGNNPAANDNIFVYESATDYVGPVTLLSGQKFIGQDATATLSSITGITPPVGSDALPPPNPTGAIVNITGNGITVGSNNTLRGFTGGNSTSDINGTGFGTLNVSEVTLNGTGNALNLSTGTLNGSFASISSASSATTGISLTSVAGSTTSGATTVTNSTGIGISVNTSGGSFGFANTSVTGAGGTGVSLTTNTGAITFGSLTITAAGSQRALLATDNTNTITATSGAITSATGTAVEITRASSTTPLSMVLTSVSNSGAPNGIMLKNTSGSFTVVGDGANTTVGGNNTGGTISNATGANAATSGNAVYLENAGNVTLRRVRINGTNQNFGIRGVNTSNFTLEFSTVTGTNGNSAADDEGAVGFNNLTGTAAITSCVIEGGFEDNLSLVNTSGTLNRMTISGSTFGLNNSVSGNSNIRISSNNVGTTLNVTLKSSLIKGARADWISAIANSGSTMDAVIGGPLVADGNNFDNTGANANPGAAAGGNRLVTTSVGTQTVDIRNNTLKGSKGEAMLVRATSVGATRGNLNARVRNNTIGVAATANSGSSEGSGIFLTGDGGGNVTAAITSNTVRQYNNHGIRMDFGDELIDGAAYNVTVTGNTIANPGNINTDFNGLHLNNGTVGATDNFTTCLDLNTNTLTGSGSGATSPNNQEFRLRQRQSTTVRLPGYAAANNNDAQVVNFIRGQNTVSAGQGAASNTVPTGGGFVGGAACTAPSFAFNKPNLTDQRNYMAHTAKPKRHAESTNLLTMVREVGTQSTASQTASNYTKTEERISVTPPQTAGVKPAITSVGRKVIATELQTLSHHAKIAKRNGMNPATDVVRNTSAEFSSLATPVANKMIGKQQVQPIQKKGRAGMGVIPQVVNLSGETVSHSIGTLLGGKTVHIQFQVTVNSPYSGGANVSNQGTVSGSNFSDVLTDDPSVGGANDPTTTAILATPNMAVADAQANEPASGSAPMLFIVSLSAPAGPSGASVHYATADQAPGVGHAVAGVDYTAVPDTVLNFAAGEQLKTVSVNILADGAASEGDETFLLNLSNPTNANITDGQAIGTIKEGNAAGTFVISEIRTTGPGGAGDDFVELYNNSDSPLTVAASDASSGYGLYKLGGSCGATPTLIGAIPNGTIIPARGHYLFVGSQYSLANYGGTGAAAGDTTLLADIETDYNVAIFSTANVANLSSVNRLDAVGFGSNTGSNCDLLREGSALPSTGLLTLEGSYQRDQCGKLANSGIFGNCPTGGLPKDSNNNVQDFYWADTAGTFTPAGQHLGAPGPEKMGSPIVRNAPLPILLVDATKAASVEPNRGRNLTPVTNGANGTLTVRRRIRNDTGGNVTRLRFRIIDLSTLPTPAGIADMRALDSLDLVISGVLDSQTCAATGTPATTPCSVTVKGTVVETPPAQPIGGGTNSTYTVVLGSPLPNGASINIQWVLGVQTTGSFKFFFNVEALP
jgi:hypothetical protein